MVENDKLIKVYNGFNGTVGYDLEDMDVSHRNYYPGETKEVTFKELAKVAVTPGGRAILKNYLVIKDYEACKELLGEVPPEYYYTKEDVTKLLSAQGSLDAFLDCLDFAPDGIIELIKDLSVDLPLNDVQKRNAILEKTGFNVDAAIRVKTAKMDGENSEEEEKEAAPKRRTSTPTVPVRRVKIVSEDK